MIYVDLVLVLVAENQAKRLREVLVLEIALEVTDPSLE